MAEQTTRTYLGIPRLMGDSEIGPGYDIAPEFRVLPSAPIADQLTRIGFEEVDFAAALARRIPADPSRSVHQCRKAIKRLRALIRLGKGGERGEWRRVDRLLRDAGRLLAEARDADVLARTAERLKHHLGRAASSRPVVDCSDPERETIAALIDLLSEARAVLASLIAHGEWNVESIRRGVDRGYRKTRRDMDRFRRHGRPSDAHTWRKGVQRHANQIRLMASFMPVPVDDRITDLDRLARLLGEYQDLSILQAALESGRARAGKKLARKLAEAAMASQRDLRKEALALGAPLFREDGLAGSAGDVAPVESTGVRVSGIDGA